VIARCRLGQACLQASGLEFLLGQVLYSSFLVLFRLVRVEGQSASKWRVCLEEYFYRMGEAAVEVPQHDFLCSNQQLAIRSNSRASHTPPDMRIMYKILATIASTAIALPANRLQQLPAQLLGPMLAAPLTCRVTVCVTRHKLASR